MSLDALGTEGGLIASMYFQPEMMRSHLRRLVTRDNEDRLMSKADVERFNKLERMIRTLDMILHRAGGIESYI